MPSEKTPIRAADLFRDLRPVSLLPDTAEVQRLLEIENAQAEAQVQAHDRTVEAARRMNALREQREEAQKKRDRLLKLRAEGVLEQLGYAQRTAGLHRCGHEVRSFTPAVILTDCPACFYLNAQARQEVKARATRLGLAKQADGVDAPVEVWLWERREGSGYEGILRAAGFRYREMDPETKAWCWQGTCAENWLEMMCDLLELSEVVLAPKGGLWGHF